MKVWQVFSVGVVALLAFLLLPFYESWIAGVAALIVVAVVAFGFLLQPRTEVFHVRTTAQVFDPDSNVLLEHDLLAVKVEVARLWLLFLPTSLAVAFLTVTAGNGTVWNFSLLNLTYSTPYGPFWVWILRVPIGLMVLAVSIWIGERLVIRDAKACCAGTVTIADGRVSYVFVDGRGACYGGEGFYVELVQPAVLARLVLYRARKPGLNKIGMGLLFHRLVILGRGLTDLDEEMAVAGAPLTETIS